MITLGLFLLMLAKRLLHLPHIVCLCGSTKFYSAFQKANLDMTIKGYIVLSIGCDTKSDSDIEGVANVVDVKLQLDRLHKYKILLSDSVHVLNVHKYIGESTRSEIEHAKKYKKDITYLEMVV